MRMRDSGNCSHLRGVCRCLPGILIKVGVQMRLQWRWRPGVFCRRVRILDEGSCMSEMQRSSLHL